MKSTWFGDRSRYDFSRLLHESDHGMNLYDVFGYFLQTACGALRQGVHCLTHGQKSPEIEEEVVRAQQAVKHPRKLSEAFGVLVESLEVRRYDFLGTTSGELGLNDKSWKGQCFTPAELCQVIAQMTLGDCQPDPEHRLTIDEPACGGGAMVIAVAEILKSREFWPWNYWIRCTDVDWKCFAMTYIQLTLLGIPAQVICGNTLTLEVRQTAVTFAGAVHPLRRRQSQSEPEPAIITMPTASPKQLSLFSA